MEQVPQVHQALQARLQVRLQALRAHQDGFKSP